MTCMDNDRQSPRERLAIDAQTLVSAPRAAPSLPASARLSINRCNLPAVILGSLSFQQHPVPLEIDGIRAFHSDLFAVLAGVEEHAERAQRFRDYMTVHFCLDHLEAAGLDLGFGGRGAQEGPSPTGQRQLLAPGARLVLRLRRARGGRPQGLDRDPLRAAWLATTADPCMGAAARPIRPIWWRAAHGLYGTNALEAQLDLLYTYCQYELSLAHPGETHLRLYRGINRIDEHEVLERRPGGVT